MLGVSVRALKRQQVGTLAEFSFAAEPDALPGIGLDGTVAIEGRVTNLGDEGFLVALVANATITRECARCLTPVHHSMRAEAEDTFAQGSEQQVVGDEVLDLEPMISEALVLEEPTRLLCGEECLGLCPHCGKNLNEGPCGCREPDADPRFEVLRQLVSDKEENR